MRNAAIQLDLPYSVVERVELTPAEDALLYLLRQSFPEIPCYSLIPENPPNLFILVRKDAAFGGWDGDPRFVDVAQLRIDVFTVDPDGDEKGGLVSEAVRVALRDAWLDNTHIPGRGWVVKIKLTHEPSRKADWATSAGPVQYADLPTGYWRYESKYELVLRREINR